MTLKQISFYSENANKDLGVTMYIEFEISAPIYYQHFLFIEERRFVKRSASAPCEISYSNNDANDTDIDVYDINFVKYEDTKLSTIESENEELKLIHHLGEMGFRMEDVLEAIKAVQCTDILMVLDHIVSRKDCKDANDCK